MPTKPSNMKVPESSNTDNMKIVREESYRSVYVNNAKITYSPFDVRITFANFADDVGLNKFITIEETTVIMSHTYLKAFVEQCRNALSQISNMPDVMPVQPDATSKQTK